MSEAITNPQIIKLEQAAWLAGWLIYVPHSLPGGQGFAVAVTSFSVDLHQVKGGLDLAQRVMRPVRCDDMRRARLMIERRWCACAGRGRYA